MLQIRKLKLRDIRKSPSFNSALLDTEAPGLSTILYERLECFNYLDTNLHQGNHRHNCLHLLGQILPTKMFSSAEAILSIINSQLLMASLLLSNTATTRYFSPVCEPHYLFIKDTT